MTPAASYASLPEDHRALPGPTPPHCRANQGRVLQAVWGTMPRRACASASGITCSAEHTRLGESVIPSAWTVFGRVRRPEEGVDAHGSCPRVDHGGQHHCTRERCIEQQRLNQGIHEWYPSWVYTRGRLGEAGHAREQWPG